MTKSAAEIADRTRAVLADVIDRQMAPLGLAAIDALQPSSGEAILDIGCGAGATLLQLAERVGRDGKVVGVDLGAHVLELARARTAGLPHVTCSLQDAGEIDLPPESLDALYSRFGTMFFADPVAAFTRLRAVLRRAGRIAFVCWRPVEENDLDMVPLVAAGLPMPADAPAFSLADARTIRNVLTAAGFHDIAIAPFDAHVCCGDIEQTLSVLLQVGALGKMLRKNPHLRAEAEPRVRDTLKAHRVDGQVMLNAATWIVTARR